MIGQTIDQVAVSVDPTTPFDPTPPGLEYTVAMPLWGGWYWGDPNLGPDSYFNPRTYPYPADTGNFIPRWSGAFIQPRNLDPLAYQLVSEGGLGMDMTMLSLTPAEMVIAPFGICRDVLVGDEHPSNAYFCGIALAEAALVVGAIWLIGRIVRR